MRTASRNTRPNRFSASPLYDVRSRAVVCSLKCRRMRRNRRPGCRCGLILSTSKAKPTPRSGMLLLCRMGQDDFSRCHSCAWLVLGADGGILSDAELMTRRSRIDGVSNRCEVFRTPDTEVFLQSVRDLNRQYSSFESYGTTYKCAFREFAFQTPRRMSPTKGMKPTAALTPLFASIFLTSQSGSSHCFAGLRTRV